MWDYTSEIKLILERMDQLTHELRRAANALEAMVAAYNKEEE